MARFTRGMKVWKTFHGIGDFREEGEDVVVGVKNGIVRTEECGNGITFDAMTGRELENFFPPMYQSIVPLSEKGKTADALQRKPVAAKSKKAERRLVAKRRVRRDPLAARLTLEDCANPVFDKQQPVLRRVSRNGAREDAIEWATMTDQFNEVGLTYFLSDGMLCVVAFEPRNAKLLNRVIRTPDEFAAAMKLVDRAHRRLMDRRADAGAGHRCAD